MLATLSVQWQEELIGAVSPSSPNKGFLLSSSAHVIVIVVVGSDKCLCRRDNVTVNINGTVANNYCTVGFNTVFVGYDYGRVWERLVWKDVFVKRHADRRQIKWRYVCISLWHTVARPTDSCGVRTHAIIILLSFFVYNCVSLNRPFVVFETSWTVRRPWVGNG